LPYRKKINDTLIKVFKNQNGRLVISCLLFRASRGEKEKRKERDSYSSSDESGPEDTGHVIIVIVVLFFLLLLLLLFIVFVFKNIFNF